MGRLKKVKLYCQQGRENVKLCQCEQITLNNKAHLQQKALIEKCFVNKGVSTKICYALHCYIPVIKILETYLSRAYLICRATTCNFIK